MVHFAVDDHEVRLCTHLKGKASWFLPFNQGWNDGAGNPPNPDGLKTDYLWKRILTREGLTDILENYAQVVEDEGREDRQEEARCRSSRATTSSTWCASSSPTRGQHGAGKRYLIQHSAGSGKSNSIAWLAHQLIGLRKDDAPVFDSIIVVTDRRILDQQIRDTIKQFAQVGATVGHAEHSGDLRKFIEGGKKIIISTVQKFPFILDEIGDEHRGRQLRHHHRRGALQPGRRAPRRRSAWRSRRPAPRRTTRPSRTRSTASWRRGSCCPTPATSPSPPRPRTRRWRSSASRTTEGGQVKHRPFHSYTMKQAIQEGFILDVLKHYTPVESYYKLVKTVEGDPEFDTKRAQKKLRRYVESHDHAIRLKAEIMVDHFHEQVLALEQDRRPGAGDGGDERHRARDPVLPRHPRLPGRAQEPLPGHRRLLRRARVRRGEGDRGVAQWLSRAQIADKIQEDPYRFLICADKFQTGYDEPLLHTMYVDKILSGIKAVQTLSRLNRAHPQKHDVFVLDFMNDADTIQEAFADYYRTTILSEETDPNKLHDLKAALDGYQVYAAAQIEQLVELYLGGADRDQLDPILDACVAVYKEQLDEDGQVDFKGKAKAFVRTYDFLASILPYTNAEWEKLSIFLNFLVPKLPAPDEEDLSKGILEAIDMDSYRVEKQAAMKIQLPDEDAEIEPVPTSGGGRKPEPELDRLSNILKTFNDQFGNIPWTDADRVHKLITEEIPARVAADTAYQNAKKNSDKQNARIEHDKALARVMTAVLKDDTELFKQFSDNESFRRWLTDTVFGLTYEPSEAEGRVGR